MKYLLLAVSLSAITLLVGCGTQVAKPATVESAPNSALISESNARPHETMLLVSLDDGTVIMQTINSGADVCFKRNTDSSTTCLTQGPPVIDPATDTVIGFEMTEARIDLVANFD